MSPSRSYPKTDLTRNVKRSLKAEHQLTKLGELMTKVLDDLGGDAAGLRAIVIVEDEQSAGLTLHNYPNDLAAVPAMVGNLQAILRANGMDLVLPQLADQEHADVQ